MALYENKIIVPRLYSELLFRGSLLQEEQCAEIRDTVLRIDSIGRLG